MRFITQRRADAAERFFYLTGAGCFPVADLYRLPQGGYWAKNLITPQIRASARLIPPRTLCRDFDNLLLEWLPS